MASSGVWKSSVRMGGVVDVVVAWSILCVAGDWYSLMESEPGS